MRKNKSFGVLKLAAAVHPQDKTCRPQILKKGDNKEYYNLIKEFGNISGVFKVVEYFIQYIHGMPIVNDCYDAFSVLENTNLDGLIMSKTLIIKKEN